MLATFTQYYRNTHDTPATSQERWALCNRWPLPHTARCLLIVITTTLDLSSAQLQYRLWSRGLECNPSKAMLEWQWGIFFFYVHELSSQWITYSDVSVGCAIWTFPFTEPYQFHPSLYHLAFLHAYKVVTVLWLKLKMLWPDRLGFSIWEDMMEIVVFGHWRVWGSKCIYSFDPSNFVLRNCIRNKVVKMPQENDCCWQCRRIVPSPRHLPTTHHFKKKNSPTKRTSLSWLRIFSF